MNPDAYITAEIWTPAREALSGDEFDAVMNYEFAKRMQLFFVNRAKAASASQFAASIVDMLTWYPPQVNLVLQNLLDSHDTDRFASMIVNPDLPFDQANRIQDSNPHYSMRPPTDADYARMRAAVTFQFTWLGAPMIWLATRSQSPGRPALPQADGMGDLEPYDDPANTY